MTNKLLISLVLLFLSACGGRYSVPEDFQPYVKRFEDDSAKYTKAIVISNLEIKFADLPAPMIGYCEPNPLSTPVISISKPFWDKSPDNLKEELLFHELGHCILKLVHRNDVDALGNPLSIMHWTIFDPGLYTTFKDHYLEELFNGTH